MISSKHNPIANQFIITDGNSTIFQSYRSVIAKIQDGKTYLDEKYWNYSNTTSKYRNKFLRLTTKEAEHKIASGEIILTDLN
jgi:hypothetical protein